MNRWVVLLAIVGACAIEPVSMRSSELDDPSNGSSGSDGGIIDAVHEGGMGSDGGSGSGLHDAGGSGSGSDGSGSDGSGSDGSDGSDGSGSDGSGSDGIGVGGDGLDAGIGGNGGDDAGIRGVNNDSDARTNFYACAGCGTSHPSQAGVLAFGVLIVLRRRRR